MNIKNPCKKVELLARFVVVTTKLVPDFPYRRLIAEYLSFQTAVPGEQMSLVIMDTFGGQDNDDLKKLCAENYCQVVIVPHNLTNKFQPLGFDSKPIS